MRIRSSRSACCRTGGSGVRLLLYTAIMNADVLALIRNEVPSGLDVIDGLFDYNGCRLHYWQAGPENGARVVLLHGNITDHRNLNRQFQLLAQTYRVLTLDVRGHGRSRPAQTPFSATQAVADLLALLDHLGWDRVHLVGHSMGGNIAQGVVEQYPNRVGSIVAVDCACNTLPLTLLERLGVASAPTIYRLWPTQSLVRQSAKASARQPAIQAYLQEVFQQYSRSELLTLMIGMNGFLRPQPAYRCPVPLLIIYGEYDSLGNIRQAAPRWAVRDEAPLRAIPNAGHCAHLDNPEAFDAVLIEHLRTATSP